MVLDLDTRPPFDVAHLLGFLAARALPGVERVDADGYARIARLGDRVGIVRIRPIGPRTVRVGCDPALEPARDDLVARARALLDLDADPVAIVDHLGDDPRIGASVRAHPGTRLPGAFDPFEMTVRAVLGQQVSVRAATTLAGRLVARFGEPLPTSEPGLSALAPSASTLADADVDAIAAIGLPRARAATLQALARAVCDGRVDLRRGADPEEVVGRLLELRGIGPWTASYVTMRALGSADAFPAGDLVVKRALGVTTAKRAELASAGWRPWRAYAVMHLWRSA